MRGKEREKGKVRKLYMRGILLFIFTFVLLCENSDTVLGKEEEFGTLAFAADLDEEKNAFSYVQVAADTYGYVYEAAPITELRSVANQLTQPSREAVEEESDTTKMRVGAAEEENDPGSDYKTFILPALGGMLLLAAVVMLWRRSSRKKTSGNQLPETVMAQTLMFLCGQGGVMDGNNYPLEGDAITIGRDPSCSIRYPADTRGVSRNHCKIFIVGSRPMLKDLGSTAGTYLSGKGRLAPGEAVALRPGDRFYLGEEKNTFIIREQ